MPYIKSTKELFAALRDPASHDWSIHGYPLYFLTADGGCLKPSTVRANIWEVGRATRDYFRRRNNRNLCIYGDPSWAVVGWDVNWEDPELYDDHTGERIKSAYAEPENEEPDNER